MAWRRRFPWNQFFDYVPTMNSPDPQERPYRSHLRPACVPCRRRKSRCKVEASSSSCLMCRVHSTDCTPVNGSETNRPDRNSQVASRASRKDAARRRPPAPISTPVTSQPSRTRSGSGSVSVSSPRPSPSSHIPGKATSPSIRTNPWPELSNVGGDYQPTPLSVDDAEQENPHIVGPANVNDSQILADYLSIISDNNRGMRMVRPVPANSSKPVLFATVKKRPIGVAASSNRTREKLHIIEQLIAPCTDELIDVYFRKINVCLPLLDYESFKSQYRDAKDKISPALLASLYAHSIIYWRVSPLHRAPDNRFVWNLANEVQYSELYLSPGISTVTAILLNVGGRPTTSLIGNGVQLGSAVSLAHSLGLNRNPVPWDIPDAEKFLRMKIWWSLLIHDKWSSLAHGTPPHIQRAQYDVPSPEIRYVCNQSGTLSASEAASVFIALSGLTEVLDHYLQHLYRVDRSQTDPIENLHFRLNQWLERLSTDVRRVIMRGTHLELPGAANLRLAYLSIQLLLRRIELEDERDKDGPNPQVLANRYMQARRTAEEIVLLVQELREVQLRDFWLPESAFVFPSTTTFLLRCALETEDSQAGVAQSSSLRLAWDLITALRSHRDKMGWDLGDICLAQHEEIIQKLMDPSSVPGQPHLSLLELQEMTFQDPSFIDELFPSLWDTFRDTS